MTEPIVSRSGALFAEFERADEARRAYDELRGRGYARLETYSPFPLTADQAHDPGPWSALAIVVFAGLAAFVVLLVALRLPRLWQPALEIDGVERAVLDGYWVAVGLGTGGGDVERSTRELEALHARRILQVTAES